MVLMDDSSLKSQGRLIATILSGAWRHSPSNPDVSAEELAEVAPLLLGSGAGALVWWRVRNSNLKTSIAATELLQAYRLHTLHAAFYQQKIKQSLFLLRADSVEPILIKGWANARLYPESGLRPYGDIDLCVRPDQFNAAEEILNNQEKKQRWVDLHKALGRLDDRSWDEFYARSQVVRLDDVTVRILSPEDHLHILSVHMLADGAWRPIQLCDIGAVVEAAASDFDWDVCLGRNKRRAKWVASAIGLAHQLLGTRVEHCPPEIRDARLPSWLIPNVLRKWERPCIEDHRPPELIVKTLRHPARVPRALLRRWPDPIGATIRMKASLNALPRLPFQVADYFFQVTRFVERLPKLLREQG